MTDQELLSALRAVLLHPPDGASDFEIVASARVLLRANT